MHQFHSWIFFTLLIIVPYVCALKIDDKLDFGHQDSHSAQFVQYRAKTPGAYSDKTTIPVATSIQNGKEDIEADIIVEVKTKVHVQDTKKNNTITNVNDTSEIPIIVGTAGVKTSTQHKYPSNVGTVNSPRHFQPKPLVVTNIEDAIPYNYPSIEPLVSPLVRNTGSNNPQNSRQFKTVTYNVNDLHGVQVPYFEPSYHTHHFGEQAQPDYSWYTGPKPAWQPSTYWPKEEQQNKVYHGSVGGTVCKCHQEQRFNGREGKSQQRTTGLVKIDDKLGSLN